MGIFRNAFTLEAVNAMNAGTAMEWLGIEITEIGEDFVRGTMPVDHRTFQPMKLLHGGANVLLGETLGSVASMMCVDVTKESVVDLDIVPDDDVLVIVKSTEVMLGKV